VPAAPLTSSLQDPRVLAFLLVLFGVNLLFGLGSISMAGVEQAIALSTGGGPNEGMDTPPRSDQS